MNFFDTNNGGLLAIPYTPSTSNICILLAIFTTLFLLRYISRLIRQYNLPSGRWGNLGASDIALVTGGSNGLGFELVKELLEKQVVVYVLDRQAPREKDVNMHYIPCDLQNEDALEKTMEKLILDLEESGRYLSVLINNAGIRDNKSLVNTSFVDVKKVFTVNTLLQVMILQKVLDKHLKNNKHGKLSIVTISSILGVFAPRNLSTYSASKAAQIMLHDSLQQELKQYPLIRLLLVTPGQMDTELFKDVKPTKQLVAPVVKHVELAKTIIDKVDIGYMGCLAEPFYANFLPGVRTAPMFVQDFCRWISEMDEKVKETQH
ncbi:conserved hypothetical protein [Lodderomyces elongisporus NRRL YB-4239]|uniref:NAD(P)-binding protein n=1 Tax=Lodderomyces elongisporus (strain ATCC 11503 / CBS 2605 / JCM 1781 / NBRC 1676 / NRRL YB-4239) TaxID=379508 RepID=A5E3U0_LODEL|nr:conserved hypothetical protein [Lodderomyces elongisporus NRRL YB-4239]